MWLVRRVLARRVFLCWPQKHCRNDSSALLGQARLLLTPKDLRFIQHVLGLSLRGNSYSSGHSDKKIGEMQAFYDGEKLSFGGRKTIFLRDPAQPRYVLGATIYETSVRVTAGVRRRERCSRSR
jgi:hypothetical protein